MILRDQIDKISLNFAIYEWSCTYHHTQYLFIAGTDHNRIVGLVCVWPLVHVSVWTHISITAGRNFIILGHDDGLWCGIDARSFEMLTLSGIRDAQTKMSVFKRGTNVISIGNLRHSSKATLCPFTAVHTLQSMLAHCEQRLEWLVCLSMFLIFLMMKHNFIQYTI